MEFKKGEIFKYAGYYFKFIEKKKSDGITKYVYSVILLENGDTMELMPSKRMTKVPYVNTPLWKVLNDT